MNKTELIAKIRRFMYRMLILLGAVFGFLIFVVDRIQDGYFLGWAKDGIARLLLRLLADGAPADRWLTLGTQVAAETAVLVILLLGGVGLAFGVWILVFEKRNA